MAAEQIQARQSQLQDSNRRPYQHWTCLIALESYLLRKLYDIFNLVLGFEPHSHQSLVIKLMFISRSGQVDSCVTSLLDKLMPDRDFKISGNTLWLVVPSQMMASVLHHIHDLLKAWTTVGKRFQRQSARRHDQYIWSSLSKELEDCIHRLVVRKKNRSEFVKGTDCLNSAKI